METGWWGETHRLSVQQEELGMNGCSDTTMQLWELLISSTAQRPRL